MDAENGTKRQFDPTVNLPEHGKFTSEKQPDPEAKKEGWQKLRAKRLLTQEIIRQLTEGENLKDYVQSLVQNAKKGNPKAIDSLNRGMEDEIIKVAQVDNEGNNVQIIQIPDNGRNNPTTKPKSE